MSAANKDTQLDPDDDGYQPQAIHIDLTPLEKLWAPHWRPEEASRNEMEIVRIGASHPEIGCHVVRLQEVFRPQTERIVIHCLRSDDADAVSAFEDARRSALEEASTQSLLAQLNHLFGRAKTLDARHDLLQILVQQLLVRAARELEYTKVLLGTSADRVANGILNGVSKGRGNSLPAVSQVIDPRYSGIALIQPLRDTEAKELAMYARFHKLEVRFTPSFVSKAGTRASIDVVTESLLAGLQQRFPQTVHNIVKTVGKLQMPHPALAVMSREEERALRRKALGGPTKRRRRRRGRDEGRHAPREGEDTSTVGDDSASVAASELLGSIMTAETALDPEWEQKRRAGLVLCPLCAGVLTAEEAAAVSSARSLKDSLCYACGVLVGELDLHVQDGDAAEVEPSAQAPQQFAAFPPFVPAAAQKLVKLERDEMRDMFADMLLSDAEDDGVEHTADDDAALAEIREDAGEDQE